MCLKRSKNWSRGGRFFATEPSTVQTPGAKTVNRAAFCRPATGPDRERAGMLKQCLHVYLFLYRSLWPQALFWLRHTVGSMKTVLSITPTDLRKGLNGSFCRVTTGSPDEWHAHQLQQQRHQLASSSRSRQHFSTKALPFPHRSPKKHCGT